MVGGMFVVFAGCFLPFSGSALLRLGAMSEDAWLVGDNAELKTANLAT